MIVFSNLSLKRGQTELLENASATINPKQKVGLVGKMVVENLRFCLIEKN